MSAAQVERNLGLADVDLADCEAKRKALINAWPKSEIQPKQNPDN